MAIAADTDAPVGFAATEVFGGHLYLRQMSVDPDHGRKGIGALLLRGTIARARSRGFPAIWLSTFRDVPFNLPFYAKHGFREVALNSADPILVNLFESEVPETAHPTTRTLMRLSLR